ncbi:MAG: autotransporter outer membrane beta-barrel domain-containing protein [Candidatus Omnitrophica bacterium]|nr:autotransporter outer membrane beta-barrel domain-containing protein [Candidatus Omnitrophota bacterium]
MKKNLSLTIVAFIFCTMGITDSFADRQIINGADQNYGATGNPAADGAQFKTDNVLTTVGFEDSFGGVPCILVDGANMGTLTCVNRTLVQGNVGDATHSLKLLNANQDNALAVVLGPDVAGGQLYITTVNFGGSNGLGGTVSVSDGSTLHGKFTTTNNGFGCLQAIGSAVVTGQVGANGERLQLIQTGSPGLISTFQSDVYANSMELMNDNGGVQLNGHFTGTTIDLDADCIVQLADTKSVLANITNDVDSKGTLIFQGSGTIHGSVGSTGAGLKLVTVGNGLVTINGSLKALSTNFADDNELRIHTNQNITGNVNNTTTGQGTLTLQGNHVVTGNIGSTGAGLSLFTVGNGIVTVDGDIKAVSTNFAADNELKLDTGHNITSDITNTNTKEGTLTLRVDNVINGNIGSTGAGLKLINLGETGGISNGTIDINGDIKADKIDFASNGDVTLNIGDGATITMPANSFIENSGDGDGTLNFAGSATVNASIGSIGLLEGPKDVKVNAAGSTVTFRREILATTMTIDSPTATAVIGSSTDNAFVNMNLTQGMLDLGANTMTFVDIGDQGLDVNLYNQAAGTTLKTTIQSATTAGNINNSASISRPGSGKCTVSAASTLNINVAASYIPNGTSWTIIDGREGTAGVNVPTITSNSTRYTFTGTAANGGDDLVITATVPSGGGFAGDAKSGDSNAQAVGTVLDNIPNPQGDMLNVLNTMTGLSNTQVSTSLDTMVPEVDSGVMNNTSASLNNFVNVTMERVESVLKLAQASGSKTGFSAGDSSKLNGIWAKGYGSYLTQSSRQGIPGYNAWNAGTALGIDHLFHDVATIGVSGGYAYGDVDGNANNANTYINSAQATLYGGYQHSDIPVFVDMAGCFAYNWYNGRRDIAVGTISRRANAEYGGQQFGAYIGTGYTFLIAKNVELTPLLSLQWTHLRLNSYTETEAGALGLSVGEQNYDQLLSGVGARIATPMKQNWGTLTPEVHGKWFYDFMGGQNMAVTSTFTGGGAAFNSTGFRAPMNSFNAGTKLTLDFKNDITVTGDCDTQMMEDFFGIYGSVTVRYSF